MSKDLCLGQLLSLAPPGRELAEVVKDLSVIKDSHRYPKFMCDFFERNNVKFKCQGSEFLISRFNTLELEENGEHSQQPHVSYYSNQLSGEVFSVDFRSPSLNAERVLESLETEETSPFFQKVKSHIIQQSQTSSFQLFETEDTHTVILVSGLCEFMDSNFWSIHNACVWKVVHADGQYTISGQVSMYVHYYENCNFHLKIKDLRIKKSHVASLTEVFKSISKTVAKLKLKLNSKFVLVDSEFEKPGDTTGSTSAASSARFSVVMGIQPVSILKKLRRQLPVHKVKFDWNIKRVQLMQQQS